VKIDVQRVRYPVVREALRRLEVTQVKEDPSALIVWWDGFIALDQFKKFFPYQRINKIPGMDVMCYKNTFFQALLRMKGIFPSFYTFFATTFQLPFQFSEFQKEHMRLSCKGAVITWIVKPRNGCCGTGIRLIQHPMDVVGKTQQAIVQRYITPYLLEGYKFDFRFYIFVPSLAPFTVYVYNEGLARFCTHPYTPPTAENLEDKYCHLTNTAVNVTNKDRTRKILELASVVLSQIASLDERGKNLWNKIKQVVLLSMIAQYQNIIQNVNTARLDKKPDSKPVEPGVEGAQMSSTLPPVTTPPGPNLDDMHRYFHILGIDIMLNDRYDPVVLELNDRPSMCVTYELEATLKAQLVYEALSLVTVDGSPPHPAVYTGGWERLLPAADNAPFGRAANLILLKSHDTGSTSANNYVTPRKPIQRLGYTPIPSTSSRKKRDGLPPLHNQ
jgi:hypothetical protein